MQQDVFYEACKTCIDGSLSSRSSVQVAKQRCVTCKAVVFDQFDKIEPLSIHFEQKVICLILPKGNMQALCLLNENGTISNEWLRKERLIRFSTIYACLMTEYVHQIRGTTKDVLTMIGIIDETERHHCITCVEPVIPKRRKQPTNGQTTKGDIDKHYQLVDFAILKVRLLETHTTPQIKKIE